MFFVVERRTTKYLPTKNRESKRESRAYSVRMPKMGVVLMQTAQPQNFFHEIAKITTFTKILPLEKYPLYGIHRFSSIMLIYLAHSLSLSLPSDPKILPHVSAGPDLTITLPQNTAVLNGSATWDDFGITSYQWSRSDTSPAAGVGGVSCDSHMTLMLLSHVIITITIQ